LTVSSDRLAGHSCRGEERRGEVANKRGRFIELNKRDRETMVNDKDQEELKKYEGDSFEDGRDG